MNGRGAGPRVGCPDAGSARGKPGAQLVALLYGDPIHQDLGRKKSQHTGPSALAYSRPGPALVMKRCGKWQGKRRAYSFSCGLRGVALWANVTLEPCTVLHGLADSKGAEHKNLAVMQPDKLCYCITKAPTRLLGSNRPSRSQINPRCQLSVRNCTARSMLGLDQVHFVQCSPVLEF